MYIMSYLFLHESTPICIISSLARILILSQILKKHEFFAQYGKIVKAVVNRNNFYNSNGPQGPSVSACIIAIAGIEYYFLYVSYISPTRVRKTHLLRSKQ